MRKPTILVVAAIIFFAANSISDAADKRTAGVTPFTIAFSSPVGDDRTPSDSEIIATAIDQLRGTGKFDVLAFGPDLPAVTRAVMEHRLPAELLREPPDSRKAVQIAAALGAMYAIRIQGSIAGLEVKVTLELLKSPGGERWSASAESIIAEGSRRDINRSNAIFTAVSGAVSQLMISVFGQEAALEPPVVSGESHPTPPSIEPVIEEVPTESRDIEAEYSQIVKKADNYLAKQDLPNAVVELKRAINLKPKDAALRVKLAEVYVELGMVPKAIDECKRAMLFDPQNAAIRKMLIGLYLADGDLAGAIRECQEIVRVDPKNVDAHLTLGDLYWNQAKLDEATSAYEKAVELAPDSPAPHERLWKLRKAQKAYGPALQHLLQAKLHSPVSAQGEQESYPILAQVVQDEFNSVLAKLKAAGEDFQLGRTKRSAYYQECKDALNQIDALASFLSTKTVPSTYRDSHSHGVLAVSLLAQASGYILSYLETEKEYYAEQASLLQAEARTEMNLFVRSLRKS